MFAHKFLFVGNIWTIIVTITGITATITEAPLNAVALLGYDVKFNCSATAPIDYWFFSQNGTATDEYLIVRPNCSLADPNPILHSLYTVEWIPEENTCNLIVVDVMKEQAGVYRCVEGQSFSLVHLTAIDHPPYANTNITTEGVVESESVEYRCTYFFNGSVSPASTLQPYIYWTDFYGRNVSSYSDYRTDYQVSSNLIVTAGRQDIKPYTAHLYVQLIPAFTDGYASNIPFADISASFGSIEVFYPPGNLYITSSVSTTDNCVYKMENLTCTADANPPAEYSWVDLSNNATTNGAVKTITSGGQYQCIASNDYRSTTHWNMTIATEVNCHQVTIDNMTISGSNCTDESCSCIGDQPATLTCEAYAFPAPNYEWWYDNEYIGNSPTIEAMYDGIYVCIAINRYGGATFDATISVNVSNCGNIGVFSQSCHHYNEQNSIASVKAKFYKLM